MNVWTWQLSLKFGVHPKKIINLYSYIHKYIFSKIKLTKNSLMLLCADHVISWLKVSDRSKWQKLKKCARGNVLSVLLKRKKHFASLFLIYRLFSLDALLFSSIYVM